MATGERLAGIDLYVGGADFGSASGLKYRSISEFFDAMGSSGV
jgi:hypothetical protein